ncbi:uncharacterized protein PHACADRAFT_126070 [Phanerochaete carnosa HHB-10118-sp]|uniref:UbiA prenyltransferase n=1 Tax=Phanerochaete carnosa (strain HHB-10118-sp) TaxID=650164 RepID=K5W0F3_PHACS|nr:uncharacterized protein PHACADRAFT_126070 [Phanerochaete carnosa HHB-10118-sp]EKM52334.1 hypothetical protein PHACADRAFT_126070 [Phanerochaete carnosa HHB-10118-sp]
MVVSGDSNLGTLEVSLFHLQRSTRSLLSHFRFHARTVLLFTAADMKTIFVPISVFACATAPLYSVPHFLSGITWIWSHQFMCNVSNQARGAEEDAVNKPWRPLPSGRITQSQAITLRWISAGLCVWWSAIYGGDLALTSLGLFFTTFLYDELGLAGHPIGKNFCNIGGYTTFEIGATKLMGAAHDMDNISTTAVCISGILIFTTVQVQDFADVEGDKRLGRVTFPIYAPEFSRQFTLIAITMWSLFLSYFWKIGPYFGAMYMVLGIILGLHLYLYRTEAHDRSSYILFNVWLTIAHIMPLHARYGLAWAAS